VVSTPSILFVIERELPAQPCLGRALMMARYLRARLDILFHAGSPGDGIGAAQATKFGEEGRRYLDALLTTIVAPDVEIRSEVAAGTSLLDAILGQANERAPAMVIKRPREAHLGRNRIDWQLMQACPAPLLLTDGRPWHPHARFAAAIDVMDSNPGRPRVIAEAAAALRVACGAELALIYAQPENPQLQPPEGESPALACLRQLGEEFEVQPEHLHLLNGQAAGVLHRFVAERQYDLLVVGRPAPVRTLFLASRESPLAHSLTSVGGDLLIVNHRQMGPEFALSGRRRLRWDGTPWWQWMGAD